MNTQKRRTAIIAVGFFFIAMMLACDLGQLIAPSKPVVSIGSPPHGTQVSLGQEVLVQVSAVDTIGVARVELWVDGMLTTMA